MKHARGYFISSINGVRRAERRGTRFGWNVRFAVGSLSMYCTIREGTALDVVEGSTPSEFVIISSLRLDDSMKFRLVVQLGDDGISFGSRLLCLLVELDDDGLIRPARLLRYLIKLDDVLDSCLLRWRTVG